MLEYKTKTKLVTDLTDKLKKINDKIEKISSVLAASNKDQDEESSLYDEQGELEYKLSIVKMLQTYDRGEFVELAALNYLWIGQKSNNDHEECCE